MKKEELESSYSVSYSVEFDVTKFPFWSGAKDRVDELTWDQLMQLGEILEDYMICYQDSYGRPIEDTVLNSIVWFDMDDFFEQCEKERQEQAKLEQKQQA